MSKTRGRASKQATLAEQRLKKNLLIWSVVIPFILVMVIFGWQHRVGISYLLRQWLPSEEVKEAQLSKHDLRNIELMHRHADRVFGIDVSHYQGEILWDDVLTINEEFPLDFVFIRASMGEDGQDRLFMENWKRVKERNKLRGAYHYFRPDEHPIKQADNFIKQVHLQPGDLPPVLDIEELPRNRSLDSLRVALKRWLDRVEKHYGVRPVLYSGDSYFSDFLEQEFSDYPLWIANYNFWVERPKKHWIFWQFSEQGTVHGITGSVDLNLYVGDIVDLEKMCIPYL
ncbi:MAG: glycoside hydrolase family 25 protein [Sphingobacteriaceae bacterium]